ncbi:MAG: NAD(P)-dependent oxidoreductase, partial [Candidatus Xenobia bacterium]
MTRILLADKLHPSTLTQLEALSGVEVINRPELSAETLPEHLRDVDVLVVRSTRVTAAALAAGGALGLVIRAGAGVNTIDVKEASHRGVYVANCPGKNATAVAELALGLMLAIDRRIPDNVIALREGRWNKKGFSKARGIKGCTLGIIGTGSIGTEVIQRAQPFGMQVIAWSRSMNATRAAELGIDAVADLEELARRSDIVSVHVALTPETKQMLGQAFFAAMRPGT